MKNNLFKLITAALSVFTLASCGNSNVAKTEEKQIPGVGYSEKDYVGIVELNKCLFVGDTDQIELDMMPQAYGSKIKFESSNKEIVDVSDKGVLTAIKEGLVTVAVKDDADKLIGKVNVIVGKDDQDNALNTISNIKTAYLDAGYTAPKKAHKSEYSYENYIRDGVLDHGYTSYEEMYYDRSAGLFMVGGDDIMTYTRGGERELASGYWYFQVVSSMKTRMVHITDTVKNYYDFNSADYGMAKYKVIEDILDMFFVSGKKMINDLLVDYSGKEDFLAYCDYYTKDEGVYCYADNNNDLFMDLIFEDEEGVVEVEDELQYLDMYVGTEYIADTAVSYVYEYNQCVGFDIDATYDYTFEDSEWQRQFYRSIRFDNEYEPESFDFTDKEMKEKGFFKVDTMFDL